MTRPVEYRLDRGRVFHPKGYSTGQRMPGTEKEGKYLALLPWRLGAKTLVESLILKSKDLRV